MIFVKIAVCSENESGETAQKIANNLQDKGHATELIVGNLQNYLDATGESDALLVVNDKGEVSPELVVAMVIASYLGKRVMATKKPENGALKSLLSYIKIEVIE